MAGHHSISRLAEKLPPGSRALIEARKVAKHGQAIRLAGTGILPPFSQRRTDEFVALGFDRHGGQPLSACNLRDDIGEAEAAADGQGEGVFDDRLNQARVWKQRGGLVGTA